MNHTLQHPLGLAHVAIALLAVLVGTLVVLSKKGTKRHRLLGRAYVGLMIGVNLTALLIYELFGGFGLFHWMALLSLVTVLAGYTPARSRAPGWKTWHAYFMAGSYVGLIAALSAEILTRTPWLGFNEAVAVASLVVIVAGLMLMFRIVPRLL